MRILIVTDAWLPQVNGVVRSLQAVTKELEAMGHEPRFVTPQQFISMPCPTYPEIRLALAPCRKLARLIKVFSPQAIHIATEGPLGQAARRYALTRGLPFTTAFHTKFPEYVHARIRLPVDWSYAFMRRFHAPAVRTMVASESVRRELEQRGFAHLARWGRGVDAALFRPQGEVRLEGERPIWLYVGRVAVEKSVGDFLALPLGGTKYVVGDGPALDGLRRRHPEARFVGAHYGEALARYYAGADAFVFPSRTDTFGNVLLEALASGLPVAAYPVAGPLDVIDGARVGALDWDLAKAARAALDIPREACRDFALQRTWRASAEQFLGNLAPFTGSTG
ncbi:MAG: glycosyltransferase family 4 protein [Alphaproteobacteria bacterium]